MRKRYSIGFLIFTVCMIVLFSFAYRIHYLRIQNQLELEKTELQDARTQANVENYYYIKERDGYVIVYEADEKTVYEYTSIRLDELPENTQKAIRKGIKVDSLGQIYGFLENYSS